MKIIFEHNIQTCIMAIDFCGYTCNKCNFFHLRLREHQVRFKHLLVVQLLSGALQLDASVGNWRGWILLRIQPFHSLILTYSGSNILQYGAFDFDRIASSILRCFGIVNGLLMYLVSRKRDMLHFTVKNLGIYLV